MRGSVLDELEAGSAAVVAVGVLDVVAATVAPLTVGEAEVVVGLEAGAGEDDVWVLGGGGGGLVRVGEAPLE